MTAKIVLGYLAIGLGLLVLKDHFAPMQVVGIVLLVLGVMLYLDGKKYG